MAGEVVGGFPPFSRLFIIGDKKAEEEDYTASFAKMGEIVSINFIKDRNGENKGIVYIQMKKTSEACRAVEMLNGMCIGSTTKPMKVLIATNRSDTTTDEDIMAQVTRLFVVVPKTYVEEELEKTFKQYGTLRKVVILKDKKTNKSKGLAFITFLKASEAAVAYEQCDPEFKPKFADPVSRKRQHEDGDERAERFDRDGYGERFGERGPLIRSMPSKMSHVSSPTGNKGPAEFLANFPHTNQFYLKVRVPKGLTQHQLTRLFNIVPTLEFCRLSTNQFSTTDTAVVGFSSAGCCSYAKEALHGFEYPPGCPLDIEYYNENTMSYDNYHQRPGPGGTSFRDGAPHDVSRARYRPASPPRSSHPLPDSETKRRLFIVSQPERISTNVLTDMFSRFGNLISFSYIPGKNYGFAKFASEESADNAQKYMHGETISGNLLKCLDAEDPPPDIKKPKT